LNWGRDLAQIGCEMGTATAKATDKLKRAKPLSANFMQSPSAAAKQCDMTHRVRADQEFIFF
jgi:hypothetical protein